MKKGRNIQSKIADGRKGNDKDVDLSAQNQREIICSLESRYDCNTARLSGYNPQ